LPEGELIEVIVLRALIIVSAMDAVLAQYGERQRPEP
jgi:hypothetical protein